MTHAITGRKKKRDKKQTHREREREREREKRKKKPKLNSIKIQKHYKPSHTLYSKEWDIKVHRSIGPN